VSRRAVAGVEVGRELGDLVAQPVQGGDPFMSGKDGRRVDQHGEPSFGWSDSTPWVPCRRKAPGMSDLSVRNGF
jgi:hypothetical protein